MLIAGNWLAVIFNPSFPYRLVHMLLASAITAAFLVAGLSAWRLLKAATDASAGKTLRFAVRLAALLVPLQIVVGDLHGLNTLEHQPAKIAAVEALWETQKGAPLTLFAIIDEDRSVTTTRSRFPGPVDHPHPRPGRRGAGTGGVRGRSPAGRAGVLVVPHHGRRRRADARVSPGPGFTS